MWGGLVAAVRNDLANGIPLREQVVIARKSEAVARAARELKAAGVPVLYVGELTERPEVKDILAVIQLIVERSPRALLRVGELTTPRMPRKDAVAILAAVARDGALHRAAWLQSSKPPLTPDGQAGRDDLARKLDGVSWSTSPWDFFCDVLLERRFLLADLTDDSIDGHLCRLAQWQFAYMSRIGDGDKRRLTLFRLLNRLRLRQQIRDLYIDRELPPETNALEGVRVMTVHGSKGLEFRAVHLVAVNGEDFAGASELKSLLPPEAIGSTVKRYQQESDVEAHNLLYVAVSRAKDALTIFEDADQWPFKPVDALDAAVAQGVLVSRDGPTVPSATSRSGSPAVFGPRTSVSNEEFLAYDRCPRQFLYRFGLEMGQELSPNPSLQARGLVKRVLKELARTGQFDLLFENFEREWLESRLPDRNSDQQLRDQAWSAAQTGVDHLSAIGGKYLEATAHAGKVNVGLPWGLAVRDVGGVRLHCVDFYPDAGKYRNRQDAILGQLMHLTTTTARVVSAELFDVVRATSRKVPPVSVYDRSTVRTRAAGLANGNFAPVVDRYPCARCAYSYVCPSLPST